MNKGLPRFPPLLHTAEDLRNAVMAAMLLGVSLGFVIGFGVGRHTAVTAIRSASVGK